MRQASFQEDERFKDFLGAIDSDPDFLKPAAKCMAAYAMVRYFQEKAADIEGIFVGVHVTLDHVSNPDNWISYRDLIVLMKNCNDAIPNTTIYDWLEAGIGLAKWIQTKKYRLIAEVIGIEAMFKKTVEILPTINTYNRINLIAIKNGYCDCLCTSEEKFTRFGLGHAAHWTAGVLAAIPLARGHEPAEVRLIYGHHPFRNLVEVMYSKAGFKYDEVDGGDILVDGELRARRVELLKEREDGFFSTEYKERSSHPNAIVVLNKVVKAGVLYIKEGEIFDAPYSRFQLRWHAERRFWGLSHHFLKLRNVGSLVTELEQQIATADKRTIEAEIHRDSEKAARIMAQDAETKVRQYAEHLEEMVEDRTRELRETQAKFLETEKHSLEHRITGGFAHEMRNALAGAQLEFRTTLDYKGKGKAAAEVLKDAAASLLESITRLHEKYGIPREEIAQTLIPEIRTIAELSDHLSQVHEGVSKDIDRGLSITNQIRNYAKLSEVKAGDEPIDLVALLRTYGERYRQDFERIGIKYSVEGESTSVVRADETHMNSIFSNLILNAKDALAELRAESVQLGAESGEQRAGGKEIKVKVAEKAGALVIQVQDNGPGIPEEHLHEIFEPFFSTKPSTGTGLGLGIVKRLVQLYGGKVEVDTQMGKGATFSISLPVQRES